MRLLRRHKMYNVESNPAPRKDVFK